MPRPLKITLIVVGCLIGSFVALGVLGAILTAAGVIEPEEDAAPAVVQATTTTTTTAPPTTRPPTTTEARMSEEECALWALAEGVWWQQMGQALVESHDWLALGEVELAQLAYTEAKRLYEGTDADGWLDECGHWDPEAAAGIAADAEIAIASWEDTQRICRETLELLGFDC